MDRFASRAGSEKFGSLNSLVLSFTQVRGAGGVSGIGVDRFEVSRAGRTEPATSESVHATTRRTT